MCEKYRHGMAFPREPRCRVCDGPVEPPHLVCRKCWYRDNKEQEWESHLELLDGDDATKNPKAPDEKRNGTCVPHEGSLLIVLCGPSHVGKTTFARNLGDKFTVISPDKIRKRLSISFGDSKREAGVWNIYESMKCKALKDGRNVVLDACHISERARRHSLQGPNDSYIKICVIFDLPFRTVQVRCLKEKRVPLMEVKRMWKDFQRAKPSGEELKLEGFDKVYLIKEKR